jgi:hypothetical protein
MFGFRLFDLAPIAYSAIFQGMRGGAIVLDALNRVADFNAEALRIAHHYDVRASEHPIDTFLSHQPDLLSYFQGRLQAMPEFDLPIIHQIQDALGEVKPLIDVGNRRIPAESVKKVNEITTRLGHGIVMKD